MQYVFKENSSVLQSIYYSLDNMKLMWSQVYSGLISFPIACNRTPPPVDVNLQATDS